MCFIATSELRAEDLPDAVFASQDEIARFASTFDGYAHFGSDWGEKMNACREAWDVNGTVLYREVDDLRACLALELRRERFVDFDGVLLEPDERGVRVIRHGETRARAEQERYKRALTRQILKIVRTGRRAEVLRDLLHQAGFRGDDMTLPRPTGSAGPPGVALARPRRDRSTPTTRRGCTSDGSATSPPRGERGA